MATRLLIAATAVFLATASGSYATTINGSYTAVVTSVSNPTYTPTINNDGGSYLTSPFTENFTAGTATATTTFLQVAPVSGLQRVGLQTGSVSVAFTLTGPAASAVTGVTTSAGGDVATITQGKVNVTANYELFYGNQTDCLTWNSTTCTPTNNTTTIGETLKIGFADGAVLAVNLYNWSDWNMAPKISFDLLTDPTVTVPEPASLMILGSALTGLCLTWHRHGGSKISSRLGCYDRTISASV